METERRFNLQGAPIHLFFNSDRRMRSLLSYLALSDDGREDAGNPVIRHTFLELDEERVEDTIPLPHGVAPFAEGMTSLGRPVPYRLFSAGSQSWRDFAGFGRVWFDTERGEGKAALISGTDIDPFYADIMFGHNVLVELLARHGFFAVHASCVEVNGNGILFTGASGSGKSTAAFALLYRGHRLLADDRILLFERSGFLATTISDTVKVRRQALNDFFSTLHLPVTFHEMDGECFFKAGTVGAGSHLSLTPLRHVMVFEKSGTPSTRLEEIRPSEVLSHLFPVTLNPGAPEQMVRKFQVLVAMLGRVACHRIHFGTDMGRFCEAIEEATRA